MAESRGRKRDFGRRKCGDSLHETGDWLLSLEMGEIYRMRTMNGSGRLMGGMMKEESHVREKNRDITLRQIRKKTGS
jgi:hypothetical protein